MSDTQQVLPVEKVMYQAQEVAAVIATDRYVSADGVEAVEVDYEPTVTPSPHHPLEGRKGWESQRRWGRRRRSRMQSWMRWRI